MKEFFIKNRENLLSKLSVGDMAILFSGTSISNAFTQNLTKFNYFSTTAEKAKLFLFITLSKYKLSFNSRWSGVNPIVCTLFL